MKNSRISFGLEVEKLELDVNPFELVIAKFNRTAPNSK